MAETGHIRVERIRQDTCVDQEEPRLTIPLTPWDLKMMSIDYIQKGMLFPKPSQPINIPDLITSFSVALDIFFPLAGRLTTIHHPTIPPSLSINLACTNHGANFIHASAPLVTAAHILNTLIIPTVINDFFPLNGALSIDGHTLPLLAVQVTELDDAVFIACSLNHGVADGTSFWHFINTWSEIARSGSSSRTAPFLDRRFLNTPLPIKLPYRAHEDFINRPVYTPVRECFLNFSAKSISILKQKAKDEMGESGTRISSLQALLAHTWLHVTRARKLKPEVETMYIMLVGCRPRLNPPLPGAYLGNAVTTVLAKLTVEELLAKGLGWAALLLNEAIVAQSEEVVRNLVEGWSEEPEFSYINSLRESCLATGSSPRFDMYGNDFGWGRPVAVRSGLGNKFNGKVTVYPGVEGGSMSLEVCLSAEAVTALLEDAEFMETVDHIDKMPV